MTANEQVAEIEVLKGKLALGTCNGRHASLRQQRIRRRRIGEIEQG